MIRFAYHTFTLGPLLLAACGTEPSGTLVGQWGSQQAEVIAQPNAVVLNLACGTKARFRGPVHLDAEGRFQLSGRARHSWGAFDVQLMGQVQGARLSLTLTSIYPDGRETTEDELLAGVTPDFPGIVCLA